MISAFTYFYRNSWRGLLFVALFWSSFSACNSTKIKEPNDLIERAEFVQVLADIHLADAVVEQRSNIEKPDTALTAQVYEQVFLSRHISRAQFKDSYRYYEAQPALLNKMYEEVITELSKRQAKLSK